MPEASGGFGSTHWSVVLAAAQSASSGAQEAMAQLCTGYWYPLYAYIRRRGIPAAEAEDLTQEFFSRQVVTGAALRGVRPEGGRFRAWLLASLNHFLHNERDRSNALKRGGGVAHLPLAPLDGAEPRYLQQASTELTPEELYEQAWAMTLLRRVREALAEKYAAQGKVAAFETLCAFLPGGEGGSQAAAATRLGKSENALKVAIHRLRREYGEALRAEIHRTVCDSSEVEQEIRHLMEVCSR